MIRFVAGVPIGRASYLPNVIVAAPPSFGIKKLDDIVEETIREWEDSPEEFTVFLRTRTTVDGREAVITEIEIHYPDIGRVRQLQMTMLKDEIVWTVACTSKSEEFTKYRDDFYRIVGSLRILK